MKKILCSVSAGLFMASAAFAGTHTAPKPAPKAQPKASFNAQQTKEIQGIVKAYLIKNPEILPEMAMELRARRTAALEKTQAAAMKKDEKAIFLDKNTPHVGSKHPTVYITEFFDYQCGHCKEMRGPVEKTLKNNKDVRFVFKDFPIFGKNSEYGARVALASGMQGKYWPVHEALLQAGNPLTEDKALAAAKKAGVDMKQLKKDINSSKVTAVLAKSKELAASLGLQGTPAFVFAKKGMVNMKLIPGAMDEKGLQAMVEQTKSGQS